MKKLILEKCMNLITTYNKDLSEKDKECIELLIGNNIK